MKKRIYLSLGANLGDRLANLRNVITELRKLGDVMAISSVYETEPIDVSGDQPWFLNCAVAVESEIGPGEFLERVLAMELAMGRVRSEFRGPRPVDIDIIFFGDDVIDQPGLTVPHPAMQSRRFVLEPLAEIAPFEMHPVLKRSVRDLLNALPRNDGVVRKLV